MWREPYDRVHIRPLAAALAATGVIIANVDYRRVDGTGGWPTTFADAATATDTVQTARDYAGAHTDVALVELPATGHFEVIDPESTAWPAVRAAVHHALGRT